ncbi:acetylxylan esterase [Glaciihabitans sp. UYNi722]|uniref:acetylxylan esterase n=1 Tax=Glaciihabitans sp. UYNi722 TaxID=3156344 RepID=UPI00339B3CFD
MAFFDLPLAELRQYSPVLAVPDDLDAFWENTLAETRAFDLDPTFEPVDNGYTLVDSYDVTFSGFGGQRVKGWLHVPAGASGPLPVVVEYVGYSGGRGLAHTRVTYALAGYAHFVMDSRGQGWGWAASDTPDGVVESGLAAAPGVMTRGILDPNTYYYRRMYSDAVRAVEAAKAFPAVDADRVVVAGVSQGGGITIAVSSLVEGLTGALVDVPFLCHFERAITLTNNDPYQEIVRYLRRNRPNAEQAYRTLSYFDGAVLAARSTAPALFSTALMDQTCPPSTVFAAYNRYGGEKSIAVYPFNEHEGGQEHHEVERLAWLRELLG